MGVALILFSVFAIAVLVWCSIARMETSVKYVNISTAILNGLSRWPDNLIIIDLRRTGERAISGALSVPTDQLPGLLRWTPPRTTLVLCGANEVTLCRGKIETTLRRLGIEIVYVLELKRAEPYNSVLVDHNNDGSGSLSETYFSGKKAGFSLNSAAKADTAGESTTQ